MPGLIDFIRKQGVVGLAVGFILGGAISIVHVGHSGGFIVIVIQSNFLHFGFW